MVDYLHESLENCRSQALPFRQAVMGYPINRLYVTLTWPFQNFVVVFIFMSLIVFIYALSLEFVSLRKKNSSPLLLPLNRCKLSYFIDYRSSTLHGCHKSLTIFVMSTTQWSNLPNNVDLNFNFKHPHFTIVEDHIDLFMTSSVISSHLKVVYTTTSRFGV